MKKSLRFKAQLDDLHGRGYRKIDKDMDNFEEEAPEILFKAGFRNNERIITCKKDDGKYEVWKINHSSSDNNQGGSSGFRIFYTEEADERVILLGIYLKSDIEGENYKKIAEELIEECF